MSTVLLITVVLRERYGRQTLDVLVALTASVAILAAIHYGAMRAR